MKQKVLVMFIVLTLSGSGLAMAEQGSCTAEIDSFKQSVRQREILGSDVGTAPQTVDAQLEHQPTPRSVAHAESVAKAKLEDILSRADTFNAEGREADCKGAIEKGRLLLTP